MMKPQVDSQAKAPGSKQHAAGQGLVNGPGHGAGHGVGHGQHFFRFRLLKWLIPILLFNVSLIFLFSSPKDGVHCRVFVSVDSARPNSKAAADKLLKWALARGLQLNTTRYGLTLLPDVSYSGIAATPATNSAGSNHDGGASEGGGVVPSRKVRAHSLVQQALLSEHGWAFDSWRQHRVRGLAAKQDIGEEDEVCRLPLSLALWCNQTQDGPIDMSRYKPWERLAIVLLEEKALGFASAWAPYIESLPSSVPLPVLLPPEELRQIQWGWARDVVAKMQVELMESFHSLQKKHVWIDLDDFRWAVSIVHSRAFTLPMGDNKEELVLMPFMDMINHHFFNQIDWMAKPITSDKVLPMVLKRSVKKGQQIFTSFGPRSNDNLFQYYGFLLEDNPFDALAIFSDFEDAVKWLLTVLESDCQTTQLQVSQAGTTGPACPTMDFQHTWSKVKGVLGHAKAAEAMEAESNEWWDLVALWGELGFEFLPYRAGPDVRSGGRVDPSLLSVLAATAGLWNSSLPSAPFPSCQERAEEAAKAAKEGTKEAGARAGSCCRSGMGRVVCEGAGNEAAAAVDEYVRLSLARRCRMILVSMPTSVAEDRRLLKAIQRNSADGSGEGCMYGRSQITPSWALAVRYRLLKKEMLLQIIHKYS